MTKQIQENSNISIYQYLRELQNFIETKSRSNHFMAIEFIKDQKTLKEVQYKNDAVESSVKRLVIRYCQYLEGVRDQSIQFTADELNALTAVHNMRKRDLQESKETLISFSAGQESLTAVDDQIEKNLKSLKSFLVVVNLVRSL